jgi:photosystem II stability/assembly factor-like uncharacterized protein
MLLRRKFLNLLQIKKIKISLLFFSFVFLIFSGASCVRFEQPQADGGVFKSTDKGETWQQKVQIATGDPKKKATISNVNVVLMVMDPQNNQTIYLGTTENGLYFTNDGGESWQRTAFQKGRINAIAIDPKTTCNIYVATGNKIYKTADCIKTWSEIYVETRPNQMVTSLAVDFYDPKIIYAGLSAGELLKSTDEGASWSVIKRFDDKILKILFSAHDSRIIYVATQRNGLWKSTDAGAGWISLNSGIEAFPGAFDFKDLILDLSKKDTLILVSKYGLLKTVDGGSTWQPINLLTPPESIDIFSIAVNPQNGNEIYYGTATTFYKSVNGGERWIPRRLPTGRAATFLLVDPQNPNIIYLGTTKFKK